MSSAAVTGGAPTKQEIADAVAFAAWFLPQRCCKGVLWMLCTRPKRHTGRCGYYRKTFERMQGRWRFLGKPGPGGET